MMRKLAIFSILFVAVVVFSNTVMAVPCEIKTCTRGVLGSTQATLPVSENSEQCYYCGWNKGSCDNGTVVAYLDSMGHAINIYKCDIGAIQTTWESYNPTTYCGNSELSEENGSINMSNAKKYYSLNGGSKVTGYKAGSETIMASLGTSCVYIKCNNGFEPSSEKTKCVEKGKASCEADTAMKWENGTCVCKKHPVEQVVNGKCVNVELEKQKQKEKDDKNAAILAARKAECKAASASGAYWNASKGKCECKDNKIWNGGTCIVPAAVCPKDVLNWLQEVISGNSYDNYSKDIKDKIDNLMKICSNKKQSAQEKFDSDVNDLKRLIEKYEETKNQKIKASENNIKSLSDEISGVTSEFEVSHWKTTEGEFNKTRLLSDSVAGVVLGTAGGLITSSVIKKNQTDNGFDDISCTVGGQVVSGWGDEFTVGIR